MLKRLIVEQQPGTTVTFYYEVGKSELPVILMKGKNSGQTLLITAGIHGSEYPGIEAAKRLKQILDPDKLSGNLIILPCVNQAAFFERRAFINPMDGKNLNRCFPGKQDGTESEKIAYALENDFFSAADFYLDFHSGDLPEKLDKFVFVPGVGEARTKAMAREAADYLDLPFGVLSQSRTGAYNHACLIGVPALLIERGGYGERSETAIDGFLDDTYRILGYLKILNNKTIDPSRLALLKNIHYLSSSSNGLWTPARSVGDTVKLGEPLGVIEDFFGIVKKQYIAEQAGKILYQNAGLSISQGESLLAYGY